MNRNLIRIITSGLLVFLFSAPTFGQDDSNKIPPPELKGYIKFLSNATNINLPIYEDLLTTQLLHHRLNVRWDLQPNLVFHAGWRNQVFFGEQVELDPTFAERLKEGQNDYFNLSWNLASSEKAVINTTLDRFYLEYYLGELEVSVGRQRVNWGINTIWNPNDIFNTFSFIDFDYGERPGSDAVLVKYYIGDVSSIEVATKIHGDKDKMVVGGLWKFNKSEYDFQVLAGYANRYWTFGNGWAGNLGKAGWKGEWTWFLSDREGTKNTFLITTGMDYSFANGWYINGGYLFNKSADDNSSITGLLSFDVSAQNLYPYKHAILLTNSYPITPLFNAALTLVYTPNKTHPLFINPTLAYSIAQDWDIDFTGQIGFEKGEKYFSPIQAFYLRVKWSY